MFVEAAGPDRRSFDARITWATDLLLATPADRRWVAPHSTYLLSEDQLRAVAALAAEHGARVHVHACETAAELAAVRARHGRTPIEVLRDTGLLGPGTVLAHGVHLTAADIALVADAGATVSHCPASNQKLASGFAPIPELLAAGVPVALGTDGAASANDLDLWVAMRLAAYPLAARTAPGTVDAAAVLAMATTGGATAAGPPTTSARSPSAPALTWWSSTRRRRRSRPATTPIRRPRTRRRGPTCVGSWRPAGSSSTTAAWSRSTSTAPSMRCASWRRGSSPRPPADAPGTERSGPYRTVGYGAIVGGNS